MSASISSISAERLDYYRDAVAAGREDYFSGHGERPPTRAAFEFDSTPDMTELDVNKMLDQIKSGMGEKQKVAAFDLTFSPPKSVSVLWGLDAEAAKIIEECHNRAVQDALASIEWYTRTGRGGVNQWRVDHPELALNFRHRTSRALDPQLHSHVLIENRVTHKGSFLTLDGAELYAQVKSAGMVYDMTLRYEISHRLGLAWTPTLENGTSGEIVGISQKLIDLFSSRRQEIEDKLNQWRVEFEKQNGGRKPSEREERIAAQGYTLATRKAKKDAPADDQALRDYWLDTALEVLPPEDVLGVALRDGQPGLIQRAKEAAKSYIQDRIDAGDRAQGLLDSLVGVRTTEERVIDDVVTALEKSHHPSFNRYQTREQIMRVLARRDGESMADFEDRVDEMYKLVELDPRIIPLTDEAETLLENNRDGLIKAREHRIATVAHLTQELQLFADLSTINEKREQRAALANLRKHVEEIADDKLANDQLNRGQAEALKIIVSGDTLASVLVGAAGTGKTTALTSLKEGIDAAGWNCLGLAKSGKATAELSEAVGPNCKTLDKWRVDQLRERGFDPKDPEALEAWRETLRDDVRRMERPLSPTQSSRTVIIVDEASFAETEILQDVALYARAMNGRLILTGDYKQLGAVDKGGIFYALGTSEKDEIRELLGTQNLPIAKITEVVRQQNAWERASSQAIREGGNIAKTAIDVYVENDRLHIAPTLDEAAKEIGAALTDDFIAGKDSLAMAFNNEVVKSINRRTHAALLDAGYLSADPVKDLKWHKNEKIRLTKNYYEGQDQVASNNEIFKVVATTGKMVQLDKRVGDKFKRIELPLDFVKEHSDYAYALTTHGAQGATTDDAYFVATNQTTCNSFYVGISRGRRSNHIWTSKADIWGSPEDTPIPAKQQSDRERIIDGLKQLVAQNEDTNAIAAAQHEARAMRTVEKTLEAKRLLAEKEARATERVRPGVQQGWGLEL